MNIETVRRGFTKLFATNSTTTGTSITGPAPTTTQPSGDGIFNPDSANQIQVVFFGTSTANQTLKAQITAWHKVASSSNTTLWFPTPLLYVTATLGASPGIASTDVDASQLFADTIALGTAFVGTNDYRIFSPADDTIGSVIVDYFGAELIQVQLVRNGSAASTNCLVRPL